MHGLVIDGSTKPTQLAFFRHFSIAFFEGKIVAHISQSGVYKTTPDLERTLAND